MRYGEHEEWLNKEYKAGRIERPQYFDERPVLHESLSIVWDIFHNLASKRVYGYAANPIQSTEIFAVLDGYGINGLETRLEYYELISALDKEWLKIASEKQKEENS